MKALLKKELQYYFNNPIGFIIICLFAIVANFLFLKDLFVYGSASLRPFFNLLPWISLIFVPALGMRVLSEEKRTNTIELLLSLPVTETQIIVAKFIATIVLLSISLLLTFALPISLAILSKLYLPEVLVGYMGSLLFMSAASALTLLCSAQTKNQVVAFLFSTVILFVFITVNSDFMANMIPQFMQSFINMLSPMYHLQNFVKGVIDIRSVFYFISAIIAVLTMTIVTVEKRG